MERATLEQLPKPELIEIIVRLDRQVAALEVRCTRLEKQNAELAARCAKLAKENGELAARCAKLEKENAELAARCAKLESDLAKARKNSSNSSKPPSSDIVKAPRPAGRGSNGRIGGQPGHERHERAPFPPEQVDHVVPHVLACCPDCGGRVRLVRGSMRVVQQVELVERPVEVTEHRAGSWKCEHCGKIHCAPLPPEVRRGGLMGPRLTAATAFLKGVGHASYTTTQEFLRSVFGVPMSRGYLAKQLAKVSCALDASYAELLARVRNESRVNVDETGHKEKGKLLWTWCFRSPEFALYLIEESRGSDVLIRTLGEEFKGILGCDYFRAYRKYMGDFNILVQFCLAHLIRDVRFLTTLSDRATRNYGERVLAGLRGLFRVIHRREKMSQERFQKALERERRELVRTAKRAPMGSEAQNMADRFRKHGAAYFRFITTPGVEPTNNLAEQALRFIVIDRRITQGTRGVAGRRWCERIWTALSTCAMQHRNAFDYLHQTIRAHFNEHPLPSLLPVPAG